MSSALLQKQECISVSESLNIVRNAVRTALSSIAYLRNLFDEDGFEDKEIGDLHLKILRGHNPESRMILNWLEKGVFDALEKRYLRLLAFGIHNQDDELLECYHFKFSYDNSSFSVSSSNGKIVTRDEARDQTLTLLRSLIVLTQSLTPLPPKHHYSLKIWYYDDRVPSNYEPEYFKPADPHHQLKFGDIPQDCTIGNLGTGIHDLSVRIKTVAETDDSVDSETASINQDPLNGEIITTQHAPTSPTTASSTESDDLIARATKYALQKPHVRRQDMANALKIESKEVTQVIKVLQRNGTVGQYNRKSQVWPVLTITGKRNSTSSIMSDTKRQRYSKV